MSNVDLEVIYLDFKMLESLRNQAFKRKESLYLKFFPVHKNSHECEFISRS